MTVGLKIVTNVSVFINGSLATDDRPHTSPDRVSSTNPACIRLDRLLCLCHFPGFQPSQFSAVEIYS